MRVAYCSHTGPKLALAPFSISLDCAVDYCLRGLLFVAEINARPAARIFVAARQPYACRRSPVLSLARPRPDQPIDLPSQRSC